MDEGGSKAKAGQLVRCLNIPAKREYGTWDDLHGFKDGTTLSDAVVAAAETHYGHGGRAFLEKLTRDERDWRAHYDASESHRRWCRRSSDCVRSRSALLPYYSRQSCTDPRG